MKVKIRGFLFYFGKVRCQILLFYYPFNAVFVKFGSQVDGLYGIYNEVLSFESLKDIDLENKYL